MQCSRGGLGNERSEAGETLLEVLLATALLAIVVVGILGGLATTVIASAVHRDQADSNTVLVAAAEALKSPDVTRVACDPVTDDLPTAATDAYLAAARAALPAGWDPATMSIESVKFQNVGSSSGAATVTFEATCQDTGSSGLTLQLITLKLDVAGDKVTSRLTFIKGDE